MATYLSLGGEVCGFEKLSITPYLHILMYHVPKLLKFENSLKSFTGQGVEKNNDIVRAIYHNKSNRHDACKEAIQALKRIDHLQEYERDPREYKKQNNNYWNVEIYEQRRKKPRLCVDVRDDPEVSDLDVDNMSIKEIKEKLKQFNITTKLRKIEKLRDILKQHLGAQNT